MTKTTHEITKLTRDAEYRFRVTAVNSIGPGEPSKESPLFKIVAPVNPEAPVVKKPLQDTKVGIKQSVTLSCIISGVPKPSLRWFKDKVEFTPKSSSFESGCAQITLHNTAEDSAGIYTCSASNSSGTCTTSCQLLIEEIPKIVPDKKSKTHTLAVEKSWSLSAKVSGLPRPKVTWTKNGISIDDNNHYIVDEEVISSDMCNTKLSIISAERNDMATFTVTASNKCGTASFDVTLKIIGKEVETELIPIAMITPF